MPSNGTPSRTVKTTETALSIIELLQELEGARVAEIAEDTGLANSTVHCHLSTLEANGYVIQEGDTYQLGARFLQFGEYVRNRRYAYEITESKVKEVAEETKERCQFIVEEHGRGVYLHRETGSRAVWTDSGLGKRIHLHATASGKALLAALPLSHVTKILDRWGLPALTDQTITDREDLMNELETVAERGYATNEEESTKGLCAIGVAIRGRNEEVVGAISVSGPTHRMKGDVFESEIPDMLLGTANELELNIRYS
jgi:DNA-binding IclR family transcriptional regulator